MIGVAAVCWIALGLPAIVWVPKIHSSWSQHERLFLLLLGAMLIVTCGPLTSFAAYRSYRMDPGPLWWHRSR